jgi:hypothetical protein
MTQVRLRGLGHYHHIRPQLPNTPPMHFFHSLVTGLGPWATCLPLIHSINAEDMFSTSPRAPNNSKPQNKAPKVKLCFFFSTNLLPPSIKPYFHVPPGAHKTGPQWIRVQVRSECNINSNEKTNMKTSLFRLAKKYRRRDFNLVLMS